MEQVTLSVRNLLTLLLKLNRVMVGELSPCALIKHVDEDARYSQTIDSIVITSAEQGDAFDMEPTPRLTLSRVTMARLLWLLQEVDANRAAEAAATIGAIKVVAVRDAEYYADWPIAPVLPVDDPSRSAIPPRRQLH